MKVGLVCPYSFDVPGGVQTHVLDLAVALRRIGHEVNVLAPAREHTPLPDFVTKGGRSRRIRYNGSVARLRFGPVSYAMVRRWIRDHDFDLLHLHEPVVPSLSLLALMAADRPVVATFHASAARSRALTVVQPMLQPLLEKVTARIAVSALARRLQVERLGGDAVEIPNGVDVSFFAGAGTLSEHARSGCTIGFVGRFDEPRKGMPVLLEALRQVVADHPELRVLVVGRGDAQALRRAAGPELADRLVLFGQTDDATKARVLRTVDVYCAPNTGGESFGMVLTEAMAAGAAVVASNLDAFRRVLDDGRAGALVPVGDPAALAAQLSGLLADPQRRAALAAAGRNRARGYDWSALATQVVRVYETALAADPRRLVRPEPVR